MDIVRKFGKFAEIVRHNGGALKSLKRMLREDELKIGKLVGTDRYGNQYYENNSYFWGRNRWVVYNELVGRNYDPSQIPAEWFGWIHYKTDLLPHQDPSRPKHAWMDDHKENLTGTPSQYVPYSTCRPKLLPWQPKSSQSSLPK